jgi:hypothetical protein
VELQGRVLLGFIAFCAIAAALLATGSEIVTRSVGPEILVTFGALWCLWSLRAAFRSEQSDQVLAAEVQWLEGEEVQSFLRRRVCVSKAVLWNSKALDGIAAQRGCPPLTAFVSRPREQGEPDRLRAIQHEPGQALATVAALLDALGHEPRILEQTEQVVRDLQEIEAALRTAKDRGGKFYFHLGEGTFWSDPDWRRRYDELKIERTELA